MNTIQYHLRPFRVARGQLRSNIEIVTKDNFAVTLFLFYTWPDLTSCLAISHKWPLEISTWYFIFRIGWNRRGSWIKKTVILLTGNVFILKQNGSNCSILRFQFVPIHNRIWKWFRTSLCLVPSLRRVKNFRILTFKVAARWYFPLVTVILNREKETSSDGKI